MQKAERNALYMVHFSQNYSSGHGIKDIIIVIIFLFPLDLIAMHTMEFDSNPVPSTLPDPSPQADVITLGQQKQSPASPGLPRVDSLAPSVITSQARRKLLGRCELVSGPTLSHLLPRLPILAFYPLVP